MESIPAAGFAVGAVGIGTFVLFITSLKRTIRKLRTKNTEKVVVHGIIDSEHCFSDVKEKEPEENGTSCLKKNEVSQPGFSFDAPGASVDHIAEQLQNRQTRTKELLVEQYESQAPLGNHLVACHSLPGSQIDVPFTTDPSSESDSEDRRDKENRNNSFKTEISALLLAKFRKANGSSDSDLSMGTSNISLSTASLSTALTSDGDSSAPAKKRPSKLPDNRVRAIPQASGLDQGDQTVRKLHPEPHRHAHAVNKTPPKTLAVDTPLSPRSKVEFEHRENESFDRSLANDRQSKMQQTAKIAIFGKRWIKRARANSVSSKSVIVSTDTLESMYRKEHAHRVLQERCSRERHEQLIDSESNGIINTSLILDSKQASLLCKSLQRSSVVNAINGHLQTLFSYGGDQTDLSLQLALDICDREDYDLGQACALFRGALSEDRATLQKNRLVSFSDREVQRRKQDVENLTKFSERRIIHTPREIKPRRIWDLRCNRVIPLESASLENSNVWAISHGWLDNEERHTILTEINNYEWPVSLPKKTDLDSIRSELLQHNADYCWLDILCLRQNHDSEDESTARIRVLEWEVDIPTIGNVYLGDIKVLRYYNGLGLPFKYDGWASERHWSNRVWTLQEAKKDSLIGGGTVDRSMIIRDGRYERKTLSEYEGDKKWKMVSSLLDVPSPFVRSSRKTRPGVTRSLGKILRSGIFDILHEMKERYATNDVDKVAGIGFLAHFPTLPVYSETQDVEAAWQNCLAHMPDELKEDLLFKLPHSCKDGDNIWFPTWRQIEEMNLPEDAQDRSLPQNCKTTAQPLTFPRDALSYSYYGDYVEDGELKWSGAANDTQIRGTIEVLRRHSEQTILLEVLASPECRELAPNGRYSFLKRTDSQSLVIATTMAEIKNRTVPMLKKISVAILTRADETKWLKEVLFVKKACKFNGKRLAVLHKSNVLSECTKAQT